jgi:hypothetical protein
MEKSSNAETEQVRKLIDTVLLDAAALDALHELIRKWERHSLHSEQPRREETIEDPAIAQLVAAIQGSYLLPGA